MSIVTRSSKLGKVERPAKRLGTLAKTVSTQATGRSKRTRTSCQKSQRTPEQAEQSRKLRFALQSEAARLLPGEKVAQCLRRVSPVAVGVQLQHTPATGSAHFAGLITCASVWHCPVCASKIAERRRIELQGLIKKHLAMGGSVYMTTYTISHKRYDDLSELLERFLAARRRAKQGRKGIAMRERYGVLGTVSVLEVTWSAVNGWHPHVHELVFCMESRMDEDGYEQEARSAWERAAAREGLSMNGHGFRLDRTYGAVGDYIAKFGHEPARGQAWGVETEMTKGHIKGGRGVELHYSPFALLGAIHAGEEQLKPVFVEYGLWFKGHKQLTYSPGLKAFYQEEEKSDEELVAEQEQEAITLVTLSRDQWAAVVGNDIRAELLEVGRSGDALAVINYLLEFGIEEVVLGASPQT